MRSLVFIYFCAFVCFAQNKTFNGKVLDSLNGSPVPYVSVQLLDKEEKLIAYTFTDEQGRFAFEIDLANSHTIKINSLGYKELKQVVESNEGTFLLHQKIEELKEVEVFDTSFGISHSKDRDTLFYKVEKFISGTESTLGDVLDKLPGIRVSDNGKIIYKNRQIDRLLIEDEEFFLTIYTS